MFQHNRCRRQMGQRPTFHSIHYNAGSLPKTVPSASRDDDRQFAGIPPSLPAARQSSSSAVVGRKAKAVPPLHRIAGGEALLVRRSAVSAVQRAAIQPRLPDGFSWQRITGPASIRVRKRLLSKDLWLLGSSGSRAATVQKRGRAFCGFFRARKHHPVRVGLPYCRPASAAVAGSGPRRYSQDAAAE